MEIINRDNSKVILYKNVIGGLFDKLKAEITWKQEELVVFGKKCIPKRLRGSQSNSGLKYSYSGSQQESTEFTSTVLLIKKFLEETYGAKITYCLCNYYPDGNSSISYHRDDERDLVEGDGIYSVSFGTKRKFYLKHNDGTVYKCNLEDGDVLIMEGETQKHFKHSVPIETKVHEARINLTFRNIVNKVTK